MNYLAFTPSIRIENYKDESDRKDGMELPAFDFTTIEHATDCFSFNNKLGEGGFGSVYKVKSHYSANTS